MVQSVDLLVKTIKHLEMCDGKYVPFDIHQCIVLNSSGEYVKGYGYSSVTRIIKTGTGNRCEKCGHIEGTTIVEII
jgi:hypothetical protein